MRGKVFPDLIWYLQGSSTPVVTPGSLGIGTYYAEVDVAEWQSIAIECTWDAVLAATISGEATNYREATTSMIAGTTWQSLSNFTPVTFATGAVGGTMIILANVNFGRLRLKYVVGTAGVARAAHVAKG